MSTISITEYVVSAPNTLRAVGILFVNFFSGRPGGTNERTSGLKPWKYGEIRHNLMTLVLRFIH
jgi:hypothetical protein